MKILVVAPHPDDETLGCGGTLLQLKQQGADLAWLIVTAMTTEQGFSAERIAQRQREITQVSQAYGFSQVYELGLTTTRLDAIPKADIVAKISAIFQDFAPHSVLLPHGGDVHSDHQVAFETSFACTKWFRYPSVKRIMVYETLSETDYSVAANFKPNVFVDISAVFSQKMDIMAIYASEMGTFPFPRSEPALQAQAMLRGSQAGCQYAEAFMLLKEIIN